MLILTVMSVSISRPLTSDCLDWNEFMNYMLIENNTLSSMKKTNNEYVKSDKDDVSPIYTD